VKAAAELQLRLLDLQAVDATLDRLAHRRRTLPELAELDRLTAESEQTRDMIAVAESTDRDLGREQTRLEGEVDMVRSRRQRDNERLDGGAVSSPRELEQLQSEVVSLHRRQDDLEETVLVVMEKREEVQRRLTQHRADAARLAEAVQVTTARRDDALRAIDDEAEKAGTQRAELSAGLPADLLGLYEKIRSTAGGVGAAALRRGRCEGCHLQLTNADLAHIRDSPADEVLRCEECRRILVRTPESGLTP
jgi:predicted  nucleic acid-binding Zn-ribbon protein